MRDPKSTRRFHALQDTRELIMEELKKPDLPQDQRTTLLLKLADLQVEVSKKWQRARKNRTERKHKGGRPRKLHDSHGQPLYQGVPPKETENEDPKKKFLSGLSNEPEKAE